MNFECLPLSIPDVLLLQLKVLSDPRGCFVETYKKSAFEHLGLPEFVQDNYSRSYKNVLRGLHFQRSPFAQGKLVRCIRGSIWDVVVDIRPHSATFGQWTAETLSEDTPSMLYIPPYFAHGFMVLSDVAEVHYKTTQEYTPSCDDGIKWNDPDLNIDWPIQQPILSAKDEILPSFSSYKMSLSVTL